MTFKHTIDHCIVEDDGGELMILLRNSVIENIQKKSTKNSNVLRTNWPKFSFKLSKTYDLSEFKIKRFHCMLFSISNPIVKSQHPLLEK